MIRAATINHHVDDVSLHGRKGSQKTPPVNFQMRQFVDPGRGELVRQIFSHAKIPTLHCPGSGPVPTGI
jgi:hypothetical protein